MIELKIAVLHAASGANLNELYEIRGALSIASKHHSSLIRIVVDEIRVDQFSESLLPKYDGFYCYPFVPMDAVKAVRELIDVIASKNKPIIACGASAVICLSSETTEQQLFLASESLTDGRLFVDDAGYGSLYGLPNSFSCAGIYTGKIDFPSAESWAVAGHSKDRFGSEYHSMFFSKKSHYFAAALFRPHLSGLHPSHPSPLLESFITECLPDSFSDIVEPPIYQDGPLKGQHITALEWPTHQMYKILDEGKGIYLRKKIQIGAGCKSSISFAGDWPADYPPDPFCFHVISCDRPTPSFGKDDHLRTLSNAVGRCESPKRLDIVELLNSKDEVVYLQAFKQGDQTEELKLLLKNFMSRKL